MDDEKMKSAEELGKFRMFASIRRNKPDKRHQEKDGNSRGTYED